MRSPPQPDLKTLLVSRAPASSSGGGVGGGGGEGVLAPRQEDLLTAAIAAAGDTSDSKSKTRSVLARMHRRWSRLSNALLRRRKDEGRAKGLETPPVVVFDTLGRVAAVDARHRNNELTAPVAPSQVILHRERQLRLNRQREREQQNQMEIDDELAVHSTGMRRLRQVGAHYDDNTLLLLPRVVSVSFSQPEATEPLPERRVQLPRGSALMPTRLSPRKTSNAHQSPFQPVPIHDPHSDSSSTASYAQRNDTWDVADTRQRMAFCRLPTGLSNQDVEREIDRAIVEIASDDDASLEEGATNTNDRSSTHIYPNRSRKFQDVNRQSQSRALSDAHHRNLPRSAGSRRITSSIQPSNVRPFERIEARYSPPQTQQRTVNVSPPQTDLFEDDYLSFKGYHATTTMSDSRANQSGSMTSRGKRISSVTDSYSDNSDEFGNQKRAMRQSGDLDRSGRFTPRMWRKGLNREKLQNHPLACANEKAAADL